MLATLATYAVWSAMCRPHCPVLVNNQPHLSNHVRLHLHHWMWGMVGMAYLDTYHPDDMTFAREVCLGTTLHGLTYRDAFNVVKTSSEE